MADHEDEEQQLLYDEDDPATLGKVKVLVQCV